MCRDFQLDAIDRNPNSAFPEPGFYEGLPAERYHDLGGRASSSVLRRIQKKTPAHAKAYVEKDAGPTAAMRFGTMAHEAVLEPRRFEEQYATATQCEALTKGGGRCSRQGSYPWRGSQVEENDVGRHGGASSLFWLCGTHSPGSTGPADPQAYECGYCGAEAGAPCVKKGGEEARYYHAARKKSAQVGPAIETARGRVQLLEKAAGTEKISEEERRRIESMRRELQAHPAASKLLFDTPGIEEATIVFEHEETSVPCKARIDRIARHPELGLVVVDYKTTQDAAPGPYGFGRSINKHRYDMQGAFYLEACGAMGIPAENFVIVAQEKRPPHAASCHLFPRADPDPKIPDLESAAADVGRALRAFGRCAEAGEWPSYSGVLKTAQVPPGWGAGTGSR